ERVVPAPAAGRAVAAAGDVAHVRRRRTVAPGEAALPARAQRIFELRFAGYVVAVPAAVGQPLRIRIGIARADMDHGHVLRCNAAVVGVAPVHAGTAHEVAAALVVDHGEAAPARGGAIPGGGDEAPELGHGDFGAGHREAALETDVVPRPLTVAGAAFAVGRAHGVGAVRHHHHLRAARARTQGVGECLPRPEQAVMRGQVDAVAQLRTGRIARLGDAQQFGELAARQGDVLVVATLLQRAHAFVAQAVDALLAHALDARACIGDGRALLLARMDRGR